MKPILGKLFSHDSSIWRAAFCSALHRKQSRVKIYFSLMNSFLVLDEFRKQNVFPSNSKPVTLAFTQTMNECHTHLLEITWKTLIFRVLFIKFSLTSTQNLYWNLNYFSNLHHYKMFITTNGMRFSPPFSSPIAFKLSKSFYQFCRDALF